MLGLRVWAKQLEIAVALTTHRYVAVRSGHKIGKSVIDAAVALWWVCTRERGRVILTSSISRQVRHILWRELRALCRKSKQPIGAAPAIDPNTGLRFEDGREILGFTTDEAEAMAGFSGDQILFIIDEASGFPQSLFEAVEGNVAGGGSILATGNPTRNEGFHFDAFRTGRGDWFTLHVSSREVPNVTGLEDPIPGLATSEWIEKMEKTYGKDSPVVSVRVDGNYSLASDDTVISLESVDRATKSWQDITQIGRLCIGVDPARYGDDDSAIQPVRGKHAYRATVIHGCDTVEVAGKVREVAFAPGMWRQGEPRPVVRVDVIGFGAGVFDILVRDPRLVVIPVNVAEVSRDPENFCLLRDELWWSVREWLLDGGTFPSEPELEAELLAPRYSFDVRGRKKIESKDDIKKRLKRSPDRADALALAVCGIGAVESFGFATGDGGSEADALGRIF